MKAISSFLRGLADRFGERSVSKRSAIESYVTRKRVHLFMWEGCSELITEDQKFLLGIHYENYSLGPHIIPLLNDNLGYYEEKQIFDKEVLYKNMKGEQVK
tara:strand:+ start:913 stop:1215 length:303 start_codon:yes stop_codon:yes gene_type:complete